jgi:hypothetical protein
MWFLSNRSHGHTPRRCRAVLIALITFGTAAPSQAQRQLQPLLSTTSQLSPSVAALPANSTPTLVPLAPDSTRTPRVSRGAIVFLFGVAGGVGGAAAGVHACNQTGDGCFSSLPVLFAAGLGVLGGMLLGTLLTGSRR